MLGSISNTFNRIVNRTFQHQSTVFAYFLGRNFSGWNLKGSDLDEFSTKDTSLPKSSCPSIFTQKRWKGTCRGDKCQKLVSERADSVGQDDDCVLGGDVEQPRVVIVGGGLAGLSAAARLTNCGLHNYLLLEASDRPGGRVMTAWLGDVVVEIGAEWVHGATVANPAYLLATMEGLVPATPSDPARLHYVTSAGRQLEDTTLEEMVFEEIMKAASCAERPNTSLAHFIALSIGQQLANFPQDRLEDGERVLWGLANGLKTSIGAELSQVSLSHCCGEHSLPGGDVRVPLGMVGILAPLLRSLPLDNVRYNSPVNRIEYSEDSKKYPRAVVRTCDGTEYKADYVIVTVPLGVLKDHPDLFCPALPDHKLEAVSKLGWGKVEVIHAEYARPWWSCPMPMVLARTAKETLHREDWTGGIQVITPRQGSAHIMSTVVAGEDAVLLDSVIEESIAIEMTKLVRKFTGDSTLPYPVNILRSKWAGNPYFGGSRTFMALDSRKGHVKDLAEPLPEVGDPLCPGDPSPVLLFAGEATHPAHYGTIHGAVLSGTREADRVLRITRALGGLPLAKSQEHQDMQRALFINP